MKSEHRKRFAKLTEAQVAAIKFRLNAGTPPKNLAMDNGVCVSAIYRIKKNQCWYWVKPLEPTTQGAFGQARPQ
jgi:hypothetical protein